jgi:AAA domain/Nuclease-related domain
MARMFPKIGPQNTGSRTAEPTVYWRLAKQLSEEFVVIHSVPWLASAAKAFDNRSVPTGEVDFLVLHRKLGILAIEVKGGILAYNGTEFVLKQTGKKIDPTRQVIRGSFAIREILSKSGVIKRQIGYCLLFPESEMGESIPIALIDLTVQPPQPIVLDISHLNNLGAYIQEVMTYWQKSLGTTWEIKEQQFEKLIDVLVPSADYTPSWQARINNDIFNWLKLTPEQSGCLNKINQENRLVVTGFPGTGKTLLLIEHVRRLSKTGKKALVLTYNSLLAKRLRQELADIEGEVFTFHEQCRQADKLIGTSTSTSNDSSSPASDKEWYSTTAPILLQQALDNKKLPNYDSLVVDEGQVFHISWWQILTQWFEGKQITAFCDSTQVFSFESSTSTLPPDIAEIINAKSPYTLTINLRSPRTVFDRITQVRSSEYQQSCPRPFEEDTLSENVVGDTYNKLDQIIDQLDKEKIPKESVVILTTYGSSKDKEYAGIEIISASKFRGLESPVVVILTGNVSDETSLFSAYTRATSRCVVIYDALQVIKGSYGTFGQILLDLDKSGNIQKESDLGLTSVIFGQQEFNLISVADKTINLFWCSDWYGWVIPPGKFDQVTQSMWIHHLVVTTNHPVYTWGSLNRGILRYFRSPKLLGNDSFGKGCDLQYCNNCEIRTPFVRTSRDLSTCVLCFNERHLPSLHEIQTNFDAILAPMSGASVAEKRKLSIFLIAIGRWNTISEEHRIKFDSDVLAGGSIGYQVAYLLILTDLLKREDLIIFKLDEMAKRYRSWCPDLEKRIDEKGWRNMVSLGANTWLQKKVLSKVSKGVSKRSEEFLSMIRLK